MNESVYIPRLLDERERIFIFSVYEICLYSGDCGSRQCYAKLADLISIWPVFCFLRRARRIKRAILISWPITAIGILPDDILKLVQLNIFSSVPSYNRVLVG